MHTRVSGKVEIAGHGIRHGHEGGGFEHILNTLALTWIGKSDRCDSGVHASLCFMRHEDSMLRVGEGVGTHCGTPGGSEIMRQYRWSRLNEDFVTIVTRVTIIEHHVILGRVLCVET